MSVAKVSIVIVFKRRHRAAIASQTPASVARAAQRKKSDQRQEGETHCNGEHLDRLHETYVGVIQPKRQRGAAEKAAPRSHIIA